MICQNDLSQFPLVLCSTTKLPALDQQFFMCCLALKKYQRQVVRDSFCEFQIACMSCSFFHQFNRLGSDLKAVKLIVCSSEITAIAIEIKPTPQLLSTGLDCCKGMQRWC